VTKEQHLRLTRDEMSDLVADVLGSHFDRLRAEMLEKVFDIEVRARAPNFQLTPKGELYCNGKVIGDVRPIFKTVVAEALADMKLPKE
jgi:hypothetical protein